MIVDFGRKSSSIQFVPRCVQEVILARVEGIIVDKGDFGNRDDGFADDEAFAVWIVDQEGIAQPKNSKQIFCPLW